MHTLLLFTSLACNFGASSKVEGGDTAAFIDAEPAETDNTDEEREEDPVDPLRSDDDADGYTENQGDCDDDDEAIQPGAEDVCNGIDDDCDGIFDEDALDEFEPNDTVRAELGLVGNEPIAVNAYLHSEDDIDLYEYTVDDGFFDLVLNTEIKLSGFTSDIAYKMTVTNVVTDEKLFDDIKVAGAEALVFEKRDQIFGDESGVFEIRIKSLGGHGCQNPYSLKISQNAVVR